VKHGHHNVRHVETLAAAAELVAAEMRAGDVVIALGAGDVNKVLNIVKARAATETAPGEVPK
jgi:UDP-N-acetylmuramate--alanine ligase